MGYAQLSDDTEYAKEYSHFVEAMTYADDDENIAFETAVESYEELISFFG